MNPMYPKIIFEKTIELYNNECRTYRMIAVETEASVNGLDFVVERRTGISAMGEYQWTYADANEVHLVLTAVGEYLLEKRKPVEF